ncbi:unnamed protein product [Polarella glacialis]|uniref:Uncharacterized protein n=1 Tax=Polarella glacialis TaxID=89957 RepID=A0A813I3T9_POLGL|nr:unnamed protein product [Polarella glacialis]
MTHEPAVGRIWVHRPTGLLGSFTSRECAGLAWAFATLKRCGRPPLGATPAQAIMLTSTPEPLDPANGAWALDTVKPLGEAVCGALASVALNKTHSFENQPLATLVDVNLPGCELLKDRLRANICTFAAQWLQQDAFSGSNALLLDWQVDNFGLFGTSLLLSKFGVLQPSPETDFARRASQRVASEESGRTDDWRRQRFFFKERVYCFVEFALDHPGLKPEVGNLLLEGSMVKENSFLGEGSRAGRTGLIRSLVLPINELVDRTLCAEFQALSELCDRLDSAGVKGIASRRFVTGTVRLWTSGASCLSCVGAMRQFSLLFPTTSLQVLCSERLRGGSGV